MISVLLVMVVFYGTQVKKPDTIDYTELEMIITTDKELYVVGDTVNANFSLYSPETVYVNQFGKAFRHYMEHEFPPISSGIGVGGYFKIEKDETYFADSTVFTVDKPGLLVLDFYGVKKTVGVVDAPDQSIWTQEAEIIDKLPHDYKESDVGSSYWKAVASKIGSLNRTGKMSYLPYILVGYHPDWGNWTSYISMTDISYEYTQPILDEFKPSYWERIKFLEAPAPRSDVELWRNRLHEWSDELKDAGVKLSRLSNYFDGRLLVGVEDLDREKADLLCSIAVDIPPGILVLYSTGPVVVTPYTE